MHILKYLLPIAMIAISLFVAKVVVDTPPKAMPRAKPVQTAIIVDAIQIRSADHRIKIESYGTIKPATESAIIPQVSGKIIAVSPNFENGGVIDKGEMIVEIDPADYAIIIRTASANLTQARATLSEEEARGQEALKDWKRLGRSGKPGPLVARKPQLSAAKALVSSALAQLEKANLDLNRTTLRAPYTGRIKNKQVGIGQFVSPGSILADIFSSRSFVLRLPLSQADLKWLSIPEDKKSTGSKVIFSYGDKLDIHTIEGVITRSEGILDTQTRQIFLTAEIQAAASESPLAVGQFLKAQIQGRLFKRTYTVPSNLIDQDNHAIFIIDGKLRKKPVNVVWRNERISIVNKGITEDDWILTTPVGNQINRLTVEISDKSRADKDK